MFEREKKISSVSPAHVSAAAVLRWDVLTSQADQRYTSCWQDILHDVP